MTRKGTDRVTYKCRGECGVRRVGKPGLMFCPDCGGPVVQIGYAYYPDSSHAPKRSKSARRRHWKEGNR